MPLRLLFRLNAPVLISYRIAQEVVRKRYGADKIAREDMLQSFVRHGLTQQEAESESLLQMYVHYVFLESHFPLVDALSASLLYSGFNASLLYPYVFVFDLPLP